MAEGTKMRGRVEEEKEWRYHKDYPAPLRGVV